MTYNSRWIIIRDEIIKLNVFCIKVIKKLNKKNIVITGEPYNFNIRKYKTLKIYEEKVPTFMQSFLVKNIIQINNYTITF